MSEVKKISLCKCSTEQALQLHKQWHRLWTNPELAERYGAHITDVTYDLCLLGYSRVGKNVAVLMFSDLDDENIYLRGFAIAPDAFYNTASRLISLACRQHLKPMGVKNLITLSLADLYNMACYKASGFHVLSTAVTSSGAKVVTLTRKV